MMRSLFLLIIPLLVVAGCGGPKTEECVYKECECKDTVLVKDGLHYYPFDHNYTVTAYEYAGSQTARDLGVDTGYAFDSTRIKRIHVLDSAEILQLEKICINRGEVCNDYTCVDGHDCMYDPHHCLVFTGPNGKPVAYLETCFICDDFRAWPAQDFGVKCGDFMCDLRTLYQQMGFDTHELYIDHCPSYKADTAEIWKGGW